MTFCSGKMKSGEVTGIQCVTSLPHLVSMEILNLIFKSAWYCYNPFLKNLGIRCLDPVHKVQFAK